MGFRSGDVGPDFKAQINIGKIDFYKYSKYDIG